MLTIYGRSNSSNVRKVLWLLAEIGLDYERLDYGRGFAPCNTPEYLAMNPNALVPTMKDGDFILWESNAILRYLATRTGRKDLYPEGLEERAAVEQWLDWQLTTAIAGVNGLFQGLVVKMPDLATPQAIENSHKRANAAMGILDAQLARTEAYVVGPDLTIADTALGMYVHRWYAMDIERPDLKALAAYYGRLKQRKPFQEMIVGLGV